MIKYDLACAKSHRFEGWFGSSSDFEAQALARKIACPACGSKKVAKAPMAPAVKGTKKSRKEAEPKPPSAAEMRKFLLGLRSHVEANAENVGPRFAEEARAIHHGEAEDRPIYGDATAEEAEELREEGIGVASIPWIHRGDA